MIRRWWRRKKAAHQAQQSSAWNLVVMVDGKPHHFIRSVDGIVRGHSRECSAAYWQPWPCGCHPIKGSGGTSPECSEYRLLEGHLENFRRYSRATRPRNPDEEQALHEEYERLRNEVYKHLCICGAFDRPRERPSNMSPSGVRTDCPNIVLRSHPDFPGCLPELYEGRWEALNPAWPEQTISSYFGRWLGGFTYDLSESSEDNTEERDGIKGVIVYAKPAPAVAATA